ncbi:MAG: Veg family protein [Oscillospiraceae bacterium]|nr:Veg family protein [Oscillospiraceae bacterium]
MIERNTYNKVKDFLDDNVGERVKLKIIMSRKKISIQEGILEYTYPNIFVIKIENDFNVVSRMSFSYTELLTKAIEIVICKTEQRVEFA